MQVTIEVDEKKVSYALDPSQIYYWAKEQHWKYPNGNTRLPSIALTEQDTGKRFKLTPEDFVKALVKLAAVAPYHFTNVVCDAGDCWTGDAIIQVACFGEIKYG